MLTQQRLKEVLEYDPLTGVFTRQRAEIAGSEGKAGYIAVSIDGTKHYAHRLAFLYMTGRFPEQYVDHINGEKGDNRWLNLRDVSRKGNQRNQKKSVKNTSGVTGVCWEERVSRWKAYIEGENGRTYLGYFKCFDEAVAARKSAAKELGYHKNHGERT